MPVHKMERGDTSIPKCTSLPKVSVVVPVYNPGSEFEHCLESLRSQTLTDIEILFVDDCGADDAMDKVRAVAAEDPRIRIITNPKNLGAGPSRNSGIEAARGEYLSFVDADDYVSPDFLELLYTREHREWLDIVKGACVNELDGFFPQRSFLNNVILSGLAGHRSLYNLFYGSEHGTGLYRRTFLIESGARYGSSRNAEDSTFLLRACHAARTFGIEDRATYHYVYRDLSLVNTFNAQRLKNQLDGIREQVDYLVGCVAHDNDAMLYALRMFTYLLTIYVYAVNIPGLGTTAAQYLSGLREQVFRLPYLEYLKAQSFVLRVLVDFGVGLSLAPLSDPWKKLGDTRAHMALVKSWCNFALTHPEHTNDEYDKSLQQVLKRAANTIVQEMQCGPRIDVKIYETEGSDLELRDISGKGHG